MKTENLNQIFKMGQTRVQKNSNSSKECFKNKLQIKIRIKQLRLFYQIKNHRQVIRVKTNQ